MFDLPSMDGVDEVMIDKDVVEGRKEPVRVYVGREDRRRRLTVRSGWLALAAAAFLLPANPIPAQPADPPLPRWTRRAGIRLPVAALRDASGAARHRAGTSTPPIRCRAMVRSASRSRGPRQSVAREFLDIERAIRNYFVEIVLLRDSAPLGARRAGAGSGDGYLDGTRVMTGLWLWHHDGLRIKLRGTVPLGEGARLWPEIECAVRALTAPAGRLSASAC